MKRLWKKGISLVLAGALLVMAGACSGNEGGGSGGGSSGSGSASGGGESSKTGTINDYGWEVPEQPLEFSVYAGVGDPADFEKKLQENDNVMTKFLKDEFNVIIHKELYLDDCTQRLNLMLNSGDYPDLITHANEAGAQAFVDSGAAIDLTELLHTYGNDILTEVGDYLPLYTAEDGKIYSMPAGYGFKVDTVGWSFSMRYDWWKELNTEVYKTPEEYYTQIKKVLENHPPE